MKSVLVGFGRIGNSIRHDAKMAKYFKYASHAQVLAEHPAFDWIAVVDPDVDARNRAFAEWAILGGTKVGDWAVHIEFAVLTCPPSARLDIVRQLPNLRACLIEKPLGPQGREFLGYCASRNIAVSVNFWRRAVPAYRQALDQVGAIQAVHAIYGNGLYNNGSHLIDFCGMLFGKPEQAGRISAPKRLGALGCSGPVDDYAVDFSLIYPSFTINAQHIDYNHYREFSLDVWGTNSRVTFSQESLLIAGHWRRDHRAMENQREMSDACQYTHVDVSRALYDLYTSIAKGESVSPATMLTQNLCDRIVHG